MAGPPGPPAKKGGSRRVLWLIVGLIVLIIVVAGAFFAIRQFSGNKNKPTSPTPTGTPKGTPAFVPGDGSIVMRGTDYSVLFSLSGSVATPVVSVSII
jgi:hypothetical protein